MKKIILAIETAVNVCSVSIAFSENEIYTKESFDTKSHASHLHVFIDELLKTHAVSYKDLMAVAVSSGPGSYTGLRIGVSTAKGLCFAHEIPLISISTLHSMAFAMSEILGNPKDKKVYFQPMIDARRMEVYTALYNSELECIKPIHAAIIESDYFDNYKTNELVYISGNGASKTQPYCSELSNVIYIDENVHTSKAVVQLAFDKLKNNDFENTAYFEPFYLKDYIPGVSKVKGLK